MTVRLTAATSGALPCVSLPEIGDAIEIDETDVVIEHIQKLGGGSQLVVTQGEGGRILLTLEWLK